MVAEFALIVFFLAIVLFLVVTLVVVVARAFRAGKECGESDDWKRRRRR